MDKMKLIVCLLCLLGVLFFRSSKADEWRDFAGYQYFFGSEVGTWESGRDRCEHDLGARLADIRIEGESRFVAGILLQLRDQTGLAAYESAWIGLQREDINCGCEDQQFISCDQCRNTWHWKDESSSHIDFQFWADDQPFRINDQCGAINLDFQWFSDMCQEDGARSYVCKKDKWFEHDGNAYHFSSLLTNQSTASDICQSKNAALISIHGQDEQEYVDSVIELIRSESLNYDVYWMSMKCQETQCNCQFNWPISQELCRNNWRWGDGSPAVYQIWRDDQPQYGDCAIMNGVSYWSGNECRYNAHFICKKALPHQTCADHMCRSYSTCQVTNDIYQCICPDGFQGRHCEIDIDECISSPCQNGGICENHVSEFTCYCADPFIGALCEIDTSPNRTTTITTQTTTFTTPIPSTASIPTQNLRTNRDSITQTSVSTTEGNTQDNNEVAGLDRSDLFPFYIGFGVLVLLVLIVSSVALCAYCKAKDAHTQIEKATANAPPYETTDVGTMSERGHNYQEMRSNASTYQSANPTYQSANSSYLSAHPTYQSAPFAYQPPRRYLPR